MAAGQAAEDPAPRLLARLAAQCALRAPLFDAGAERAALLVHAAFELLERRLVAR